jgi:hypothetical protein
LGAGILTGGDNTAVGDNAGSVVTVGGTNTFIGSSAGNTTTTGGSNICIGVNARATAAGSSNEIAIGSAAQFVGTNGAANTYFANANATLTLPPAGSLGFWRVIINGSARKIAVYAD